MKFGFVMFPTREAMSPGDFGALVEDRGFESLFIPDHTHIPAVTPERYDVEGLAAEFSNGMDAFVALGAVAQATTRLQLGTAVLLVTERDPIVTAKQVASVDVLSGGRFHFGVGPGWIKQEMRNHGTDPDERWAVMRERVLAMTEIWTKDAATFRGSHVDFESITSWPKPVQHPYPPIVVAGNGRHVAQRVVEYGDEWIPMRQPGVLDQIRRFRRLARKPGSDRPIPVTLFDGSIDEVDDYAAAGVDRVLFWIRPTAAADMPRLIDGVARRLGARLT